MDIQTTRFGVVRVEDDRVITFSSGILGFPEDRRFVLLQPDEDAVFFWLQSVDSPHLAFIVTDPSVWVRGYEVPVRREQAADLNVEKPDDAQVLVIVNKRDDLLTANLQGPLLINTVNREAQQLVLAEKKWSTRHEILRLAANAEAHAASA